MTFLTVYITYSVLCSFTEILTGTGTPILWGAIMGMSRILAHGHSFVSVKTVVHILEPNSGNNIPVAYPRSHYNNNNNIFILLY